MTLIGLACFTIVEAVSANHLLMENRTTNVRLYPNYGANRATTVVRTRGRAVGTLQNPASRGAEREDPRFVDWFTTNATSGGTRVRSSSIVPNVTTWNLHARWTSPSRHNPQWVRPANSGITAISLRFDNVNSTWASPMNSAINSWNNSNARVRFSRNPNSNNRVSIRQFNPASQTSFARIFYRERNGTRIVRFDIELYSTRINNHVRDTRDATFARVVQSVMTHELGHAIGLKDNPTGATGNESIMNSDRQRWVRRTPAAFDVRSVNRIY